MKKTAKILHVVNVLLFAIGIAIISSSVTLRTVLGL